MTAPSRPASVLPPLPRRLAVLAVAVAAVAATLVATGAPPTSASIGYGYFTYLQKSGDPASIEYHVNRSTVRGGSASVLSGQRAFGAPAWSPDGRRVAFSGTIGDGSLGRYAIYVMNADGSGLQRVTNPSYGDFDPVWSPSGTYLAFTRDVRGNVNQATCCEIWIARADGAAVRRVPGTSGGSFPTWSPDMRSVAFAHPNGLRVAGITGGGARTVVSGSVTQPAWSPDGREIAYVRNLSADRSRLEITNRDGSGRRIHTDPGAQVESPTWAEDSRTMFFVTYRGRGYDGRTSSSIWRVDADRSLTLMSDPSRNVYHLSYTPRVGMTGDVPITGDWDGDGTTTASAARLHGEQLRWLLSNTNAPGGVAANVAYGRVGDVPVTGDWNGDGHTDIGVARVAGGVWEWHLRTGVSGGTYRVIQWGYPSDLPIVGDWDGDGVSTPGIARLTSDGQWEYWLMRDLDGARHSVFRYGYANDRPIAGDWTGDGRWNVGVTRDTGGDSPLWRWFLRDGGAASTVRTFTYGSPRYGDVPVTGDWGDTGASGIGVVRLEGQYLEWHQVDDSTGTFSTSRTFAFGYH